MSDEALRSPVSDDLSTGAEVGVNRARLICVNCGSLMRNQKCKLVCTSNCGYFESCSDLEPAVQGS
jgi:hypothetical protein